MTSRLQVGWPACCWRCRRRGRRHPRGGAGRRSPRVARRRRPARPAPPGTARQERVGARRTPPAPAVGHEAPGPPRRRLVALRRRSQPDVAHDDQWHRQEKAEHAGPEERHQRLCLRRLSTMRTRARTRSSSVRDLVQGMPARLASVVQLRPPAPPPPRGSGVGTPDRWCRRTAARPSRHPPRRSMPASGSSSSPGSTRRIATTSWRSVSRDIDPLPARLADEVGDRRRSASGAGPPRRPPRSAGQVGAAARRRRRPQELVGQPQDLSSTVAGRDRALDGVVVEDRADPVAAPRQETGQRGRHLDRAPSPSGARSARNPSTESDRAAATPSARGPRGRCARGRRRVRAVTFQSMWRTSSPGSYSRRSVTSMPAPRNIVR